MHSSSFTSEGPQEDEEIKCPKCFSFFSSLTKPYILPCNHNICLNCINSLIDEKNPKCPICSFHFNKTDKNSFEVNFTFLNIIIKILETKIIFCPQCNKIFYWKEHYKFCEQKNFQNCDNILDEIKINCEESAKILKLIKENGDLINKYKIELYDVTRTITKEIHKKYMTNLHKNIKNKLFNTKINIDFQKAKYDLVNFVKIFSSHQEHFDTKEINKIIECHQSHNYVNSNLLSNSYSDFKIKTKDIINKKYKNKNSSSPPVKNLIFSEKKFKKGKNNSNNFFNSNNQKKKLTTKINHFLNNANNTNRNIRNNMKEIISEEKDSEEEYTPLNDLNNNLQDEGINETERVKIKTYHDNNISKFKETNNEHITNAGSDNITNNENKIIKKNPGITLSQQVLEKKKSKFDIKSLLSEEELNEDENTKNKIIVGLKDVKVISLKQSINNLSNNKLNVKLIKPKAKLIGNRINLGNIASMRYKGAKLNSNNNNNNNKNENSLKIIKLETPSLRLLRSSEFTKRDYRYNNNTSNQPNKNIITKNKNKNNTNNNSYFNMSLASTSTGFNNMNNTKTPYMNNNSLIQKETPKEKEKENYTSRINSKTLNSFYSIPQKNSSFVDAKMLKNFNKTKELIDKIKLYTEFISYLSETINNTIDKNISLLNNIIMSNYELLLSEISFKSTRNQKNFCLSFFPNTYKIILYDPFNNKFTTKNYYNILHNKDKIIINPFNSSNSIIFDDNDLIFITGGENNYDIFLILSLNKENIVYNNKMPLKLKFHKSIFIKNKLYIIGGEKADNKISRECSFFDMEEKKWHFFPNLKQGRKNFSLLFYNDSILYAFMGEDNINVLDTIEFIDINNLNNNKGWILFKPVDFGFVWHTMKNTLVINIDKDKILICGGEDKDNILYKDCFLFKPSSNEIFKGKDLKVPAAFISEGCFYKDEIFGIDYKNAILMTNNSYGFIHAFNINDNVWNCAKIKNDK